MKGGKLTMNNTIYIVTPCRNAKTTLNETINSIVSQSGNFYIRYHVQDANSTDGSLEILQNWKVLSIADNTPLLA